MTTPNTAESRRLFGNRVRELRLDHSLTQQEVADKLGVHRKTVVAWETGSALPSLKAFRRLAEALDTTIPYLRHGSQDERSTGAGGSSNGHGRSRQADAER